jgi:hypothetical protein
MTPQAPEVQPRPEGLDDSRMPIAEEHVAHDIAMCVNHLGGATEPLGSWTSIYEQLPEKRAARIHPRGRGRSFAHRSDYRNGAIRSQVLDDRVHFRLLADLGSRRPRFHYEHAQKCR